MDKFFGCHQLATELRSRIIKETGLPDLFRALDQQNGFKDRDG